MQNRPLNLLLPGQELGTRFREATGVVLSNLKRMKLAPDGGNPYALVWVTYVDQTGISIYVTRGTPCGGDMQAFLPRDVVLWQSYFSPLNSFNQSYVKSQHYAAQFPLAFL